MDYLPTFQGAGLAWAGWLAWMPRVAVAAPDAPHSVCQAPYSRIQGVSCCLAVRGASRAHHQSKKFWNVARLLKIIVEVRYPYVGGTNFCINRYRTGVYILSFLAVHHLSARTSQPPGLALLRASSGWRMCTSNTTGSPTCWKGCGSGSDLFSRILLWLCKVVGTGTYNKYKT